MFTNYVEAIYSLNAVSNQPSSHNFFHQLHSLNESDSQIQKQCFPSAVEAANAKFQVSNYIEPINNN